MEKAEGGPHFPRKKSPFKEHSSALKNIYGFLNSKEGEGEKRERNLCALSFRRSLFFLELMLTALRC